MMLRTQCSGSFRWLLMFTALLIGLGGCSSSDGGSLTQDTHSNLDAVSDATSEDTQLSDLQGSDQTNLPSYRACGSLNFCRLAVAGCCGGCGGAPLSSFVPIGSDKGGELKSATCNETNPICPGCAWMEPDPNFVAICQQGTCNKFDARESFLSECKKPDECQAIWADCCSCGPSVIAIAKSQLSTWRQAVCNPAADCAECPTVEPTKSATCKEGHCVLVD